MKKKKIDSSSIFNEINEQNSIIKNEFSLDTLLKSLEIIEYEISNGNLPISEQITKLKEAKEIVTKIKSLLSSINTEIIEIENA